MTIKQTIFNMLTENTGKHMLDSGGAYGRNWERNHSKTLDDFENEPEAVLVIDQWKDGQYSFDITVSLYHKLTRVLALDDLCKEFNDMPVENWESNYYGVSSEGFEWLETVGFTAKGEAFNTYNWSANFSQVMQGQLLDLNDETYVLLQIHGGCDVRGGYTDAKLFKLDGYDGEYHLLDESCGFTLAEGDDSFSLDYHSGNDFIDIDGNYLDDEALNELAQRYGAGNYEGGLFY